jgi:hypothetical protein
MPTLNQCSLFESEQCKIDREKLRVKVEVNDIVKKMQKDLRLTLSRAHPCSNCHQPNFKVKFCHFGDLHVPYGSVVYFFHLILVNEDSL